MILHEVRPQRGGQRLPRTAQLAWKIAEMATARAPLDREAAQMAILRIIDDWAVALAALNRPAVIAARGAALGAPRPGGAALIGLGPEPRVSAFWGGYANATAIRELDFNDSFFAADSSHPGDVIGPLVALAEARGCTGTALLHGIITAYEVQIALVKGIPLKRHRIDHVAHLGPAVAAGIAAMLGLSAEVAYQAVGLAAHLSVSTRQTRKGEISSYKANAPGHVGQIAMLAADRAMRGETSPAPVYEGDYGLMAIVLAGPESVAQVPLPEPGAPLRGILETYPKEHSAGYHGQAIIDLAFAMRERLGPEGLARLGEVAEIVIHTKEFTHLVMGSGAGDPEKWDPSASRETLDHSAMFMFAVALQDGTWHHEKSYAPARVARPDTVALWAKVRTVADDGWTRAFTEPAPLEKAHGARVVIRFGDGREIADELRVANAHPRGARPFGPEEYHRKFLELSAACVAPAEAERFLHAAMALAGGAGDAPVDLAIRAEGAQAALPGLLD